MLLFLFIFSQIYDTAKAMFFYKLNFENQNDLMLRLYGEVRLLGCGSRSLRLVCYRKELVQQG